MEEDFPETLSICCRIAADKKCTDLKIFDLRKGSSIVDYIALATCTSESHLKAVGDALYQTFKHNYGQLCSMDYKPLSGWMVFDAFNIFFHAFTEPTRRRYDLDKLFEKSNVLDLDYILAVDICQKSTASKN
ncbi:MAG: ribosome silencing factor [Puniceicoccales bacterium]|nr:ribosome silencing factor [Puniceicoccales bacterium]